MIFGPLMGVLSDWFRLRRGLALGYIALGSSIGGTIFPIAARRLIEEIGSVTATMSIHLRLLTFLHFPGSSGQCAPWDSFSSAF